MKNANGNGSIRNGLQVLAFPQPLRQGSKGMLIRVPVRQACVMACDEVGQEATLAAEFFDSMEGTCRRVIHPAFDTLNVCLCWIKSASASDIALKSRGILSKVMPESC